MAATVMTAIVTVFAIVTFSKFLLSTEVEERNVGYFHRRVVRSVPLQALKIIVVVWQISTQVCARRAVRVGSPRSLHQRSGDDPCESKL